MGSRGPIGAKRRYTKSAKTAAGTTVRQMPGDVDRIFRRVVADGELLEPADAPLVQLQAMWMAVGMEAFAQLQQREDGQPGLQLTVTDSAHGNGEEPRKHPLLIVLRTATEQVRAIAQQLGASPMARARLPEPEPEQLSLAEILFAEALDKKDA